MPEGTDGNWANDFQHDSLAVPETKEAFVKTMSKYGSQEEAIVGGFNAMKEIGKPFRLPESLDKLPDDKSRQEFQAHIGKILGVVESEDSIPKDFNWADGLEDGSQTDENMVAAFKNFAVDNKLNVNQVQGGVKFWNGIMRQAKESMQQTAAAEMKATNEAMLKEYNGSDEALKADIELMRRTFKNNAGLTGEEYEAIADDLMGPDENGKVGALLRKPTLTKALLKLLAPLSKEGSTEGGEGGTRPASKPTTEVEKLKARDPALAEAIGVK